MGPGYLAGGRQRAGAQAVVEERRAQDHAQVRLAADEQPVVLEQGAHEASHVRLVVDDQRADPDAAPQAPWHFLNFLPDPHQHGSLRPIWSTSSTRRCSTTGSASSCCSASAAASAPIAAKAAASSADAPAASA